MVELKIIKGRKQMPREHGVKFPLYEDQEMKMIEFDGGVHEGMCIQLSLENKHIQIDRIRAIELRNELNLFIERIIKL